MAWGSRLTCKKRKLGISHSIVCVAWEDIVYTLYEFTCRGRSQQCASVDGRGCLYLAVAMMVLFISLQRALRRPTSCQQPPPPSNHL